MSGWMLKTLMIQSNGMEEDYTRRSTADRKSRSIGHRARRTTGRQFADTNWLPGRPESGLPPAQ